MASEYESNVVRYFRKKGNGGFSEPITYLGAEQRYVNALRNSGVNNLEEQFVLGTDTYTEVYTDAEENIIVEKSFHVNSDSESAVYSDYYKVKTTVYKDTISDRDFYFRGNELIMPDDINKIIFGNGSVDYPDLNTLYGVDSSLYRFGDDNSLQIFSADFMIIRKDELFFITNNGATITPVLTKTISKKYIQEGDKVIFKESIENHLKS